MTVDESRELSNKDDLTTDSTTRNVLLLIILLHLIGLIIFAIDYYYLRWYSDLYHDGRVGDQQYFVIRGDSVLAGNMPYEGLAPEHSLAPPLSMYTMAVPLILEFFLPIHLDFIYRIYFSIFNVASSWLLINICQLQFPNNKVPKMAILFGFSPYMIVSAVFAGSDECLGAFLMILILYLIIRNKPFLTVLAIGIGCSIKYYPFLLIPYFLATRSSKAEQIKYALYSILSVILFFLPFYFVAPSNFMNQFNNRISKLPWEEPGNVGIVILIIRAGLIDLSTQATVYKIFWIGSVVVMSIIQIVKGYNKIDDTALVPSVFFMVYPQFFFNYFAIIIPFYSISLIKRQNSWKLWILLHISLLFAALTTSKGFGYDTIYYQEAGNLPPLLVLSILLFYSIWGYLFTSILLNRNLKIEYTLSAINGSLR